jgi:hypothetical protein
MGADCLFMVARSVLAQAVARNIGSIMVAFLMLDPLFTPA